MSSQVPRASQLRRSPDTMDNAKLEQRGFDRGPLPGYERSTVASSPRTFQSVVIQPPELLLELITSLADSRAIFSFRTGILLYRIEQLAHLSVAILVSFQSHEFRSHDQPIIRMNLGLMATLSPPAHVKSILPREFGELLRKLSMLGRIRRQIVGKWSLEYF